VRVVEVDAARKRIALSMRKDDDAAASVPRGERPARTEGGPARQPAPKPHNRQPAAPMGSLGAALSEALRPKR
jgi:uncharacterized protein